MYGDVLIIAAGPNWGKLNGILRGGSIVISRQLVRFIAQAAIAILTIL